MTELVIGEHARFEMVRRQIDEDTALEVFRTPEPIFRLPRGEDHGAEADTRTKAQRPILDHGVQDLQDREVLAEGKTMKVIYDPDTDTLSLIFRDEPVADSDEVREGIIIDYGQDGKLVSVEVLDASEHVADPRAIAYELKGRVA